MLLLLLKIDRKRDCFKVVQVLGIELVSLKWKMEQEQKQQHNKQYWRWLVKVVKSSSVLSICKKSEIVFLLLEKHIKL